MSSIRRSLQIRDDIWKSWKFFCESLEINPNSRMGREMERVIEYWANPMEPKLASLEDLKSIRKSGETSVSHYVIPIRNEYWALWKKWCKENGVFPLTRMAIEVENFIKNTVPMTEVAKEIKLSDVQEEVKNFSRSHSFVKS